MRFFEDFNMMMSMRMRIKMRRSRRTTMTTGSMRRTTRRRIMTKLLSVIPFRNNKIETWGFHEDLNMMMMMSMTMKMRRSRMTTTTRRRTTRRRTMSKLLSVKPFRNHKIETWGFRGDLNMMMRMKMRRSMRTTATRRRSMRTTATRRRTRRRRMFKLSSVIPFWNHKIETWGFREGLNMMIYYLDLLPPKKYKILD